MCHQCCRVWSIVWIHLQHAVYYFLDLFTIHLGINSFTFVIYDWHNHTGNLKQPIWLLKAFKISLECIHHFQKWYGLRTVCRYKPWKKNYNCNLFVTVKPPTNIEWIYEKPFLYCLAYFITFMGLIIQTGLG